MSIRRTIHVPRQGDREHIERVRSILRESLDILRLCQPDTFLGRKTREPEPGEEQDQE